MPEACLLRVQLSIDRPGHGPHANGKRSQIDEQPGYDERSVG